MSTNEIVTNIQDQQDKDENYGRNFEDRFISREDLETYVIRL